MKLKTFNNPPDQGEYPTLLHFSSYHGLSNLTNLLLECPGVHIALDLNNSSEMTPGELAHLNGHLALAERLFNFQVSPAQHILMPLQNAIFILTFRLIH